MAKNFWDNDAPAEPAGKEDFWASDKPAAQQDLPAGMKPSTAGAGRGSINPGLADVRAAESAAKARQSRNPEGTSPTLSLANIKPKDQMSQEGFDAMGTPTFAQVSPDAPRATLPTDRTWREAAGDTTRAVAQGLVDFGGVMPGVVAGAITQNYDNPWLNTAKGINEAIDEDMSPGLKQRKKDLTAKLATAEGWREKFAVGGIETLSDPALLLNTAARSLPSAAAGGFVGGMAGKGALSVSNAALVRSIATGSEVAAKVAAGARAAAPAIAGTTATGTAALSQGASVASDTYDALMKLPPENFSAEPEYADLAKQHGTEKAKQILASAAANRAFAVGTAVSVGSMMLPGGSTIEKAFIPTALKAEARDAAKQVTQSFMTRSLTKGMEGNLVSKALELNIKGTKAGLEEAISEPIEEAGGAVAQGLEASRAGQNVNLGELAGEAGGQAAAAGFAMGRVSSVKTEMQNAASIAREARIKRLKDNGETAAADLLQKRHDTTTAVEAVDGELERMQTAPAFAQPYRELRTSGMKPVEASARVTVAMHYRDVAQAAGLSEKAMTAAMDKAATLPLDQVPQFLSRYITSLQARGLATPLEGAENLAAYLESERDKAMEIAMATNYPHGDVRSAMDDIMTMEQNQAPTTESVTNGQAATPFSFEAATADAVPKAAAEGNAGLPGSTGQLLETGSAQPNPDALNGVRDDANTPSGTSAQAQAKTSQATEAGAVDAPRAAAAGTNARPSDVQADGVAPGIAALKGMTEDEYIAKINPGGNRKERTEAMPQSAFEGLLPKDRKTEGVSMTKDGREITLASGGEADGAIFAVVSGKTVGYMAPEGNTTGLFVSQEFQRQGIGEALSTLYRSRNPFALSGGLSESGERTARRAFRNITGAVQDNGLVNSEQFIGKPVAESQALPPKGSDGGVATTQVPGEPISLQAQSIQAQAAPENAAVDQLSDAQMQRAATAKTELQRKAKASRLRDYTYNKSPFLAFLGKNGVALAQKRDFSPDKNPMLSGYGPMFRTTGKSTDVLLQNAIEENFLPEGSNSAALDNLITQQISGMGAGIAKRIEAIYSPDVADRVMNERMQEAQDAYEQELTSQQQAADEVGADPFAPLAALDYTESDADASGYNAADNAVQLEVNALLLAAEKLGIDTQEITYQAFDETRTGTQQDYLAAAKAALQSAVEAKQGGNGNSRQDAGQPGPAASREVSPPAAAFEATPKADGTLSVKGDAAAIRETLKDIPAKSMTAMKGGVLVGRTQAGKAATILRGETPKITAREAAEAGQAARAAEKKAKASAARVKPVSQGLSIGFMPGSAEAVTVKDGVVYVGKYPAQDYDTAGDVTVPNGATDEQIVQALRDAGAIAKRQRVFGLAKSGAQAKPAEGLTSPTKTDILDQQDRATAGDKADTQAKADADKKIKAEREAAEIKQAGATAADRFELGGSANDELSGQVGIQFSRADASLVGPMSPSPSKTPLYEAMRQLARFEDSFQTNTSKSKELPEIAAQIIKSEKTVEFFTGTGTALHQGNRKPTLTLSIAMPNGDTVKLLDIFNADTDRPFVVIGNSDAGQQVGGATAYQIAFAWAHNNGKTMRPDPAGLTVINRLRRTEAMISSAMHYGTTKHLEPHQDQYVAMLDRVKKGGKEPEDTHYSGRPDIYNELEAIKAKLWTTKTDAASIAANVQHLLESSAQLTYTREPATKNFEVVGGEFRVRSGREAALSLANRDATGQVDSAEILGAVLRPAASGVGPSTLRRAAVSASVMRAYQQASQANNLGRQDSSNQSADVAAIQAIRQTLGKLDLSAPEGLSGLLYSGGAATPSQPSTVARVQAAITELIGGKQLPNQLGRVVVATAADIKSKWQPLIGTNVQMDSESDAGKAQAFFEPSTKTVFLIADNIAQGDEAAVAGHELMHKHGKQVLGEAGWTRLHSTIKTWADAKEGTDERRVYDFAAARVAAVGEQLSTEELFPYAVEGAIKLGIKPSMAAKRGTVASWLESVRQNMAVVWGKVTGQPGNFKTQDLVDLAFGIAQMENPKRAGAVRDALAGDEGRRTINDVVAAWDALGIKNAISEKNGVIELSRIEVPFNQRSAGTGTVAMRDLIEYADSTQQSIKLLASKDFGGNKPRLVQFYKRFGFSPASGAAPAASARGTVMRREPTAPDSGGVTMSEINALNDVGTVDVMQEAVAAVGDAEFKKRVDAKTAEVTSNGKFPASKSMLVEATAREIVALARRGGAPIAQTDTPTKDQRLDKYLKAGKLVDGLQVKDETPNTDSIAATFSEYEVLPGIRVVSFSEFSGPDAPTKRTQKLAADINDSGEISPLIVAIDKNGPYILEGAHRYDALQIIGKTEFPAMVVIDKSDDFDSNNPDIRYSIRDVLETPLPDAIIGSTLGTAAASPQYALAKSGDVNAAFSVAKLLVTPGLVAKVKAAIGKETPMVVPVVSIEAAGKNKLPLAAAELLAAKLGLDVDTAIVQSSSPKRTAMTGLDRILASPEFDGEVLPGQSYVLVDDTLTQGATFAALASHIQAGGGKVIASVALTSKAYSAKLAPSTESINSLRTLHGTVEPNFKAATGYGFDGLTQSEVRYLTNFAPTATVRNRFIAAGNAARQAAAAGANQGVNSAGGNVPANTGGTGGVGGPTGNLFQPNIWSLPPDSKARAKIDRLIYEFQDNKVDLKRAQEAITKSGQAIAEKFDARLAETLYPGRVASRSEAFLDVEVKPLLEAMVRNKVATDELADYLHARGAEERNVQIAKVNPSMPDGGAGTNTKGTLLTTQAARDYLKAVSPARKIVLDAMAKRVDAITAGTRQLLVSEGLEKQETVDAWTATYKNYVPMFRDEAEQGGFPAHPQGAGFTVKGSATKRARGSTKEVTNILAHVLMQREAAITRGEKNRVALALYGQALSHPNPEFWTTIKPGMDAASIGAELVNMGVDPMTAQVGMQGTPTITTISPLTGKVVQSPNPAYKTMPGAITLKVNGEDRVLMLNVKDPRGERLATSLKNLDGLTQLDLAGSIVGKSTRWLAAVNTQYNPAFGLVNLTRDVLGGVIHLGSTELRGKSLKVLANTPGAILGIARELATGNQNGKWGKLYRQFVADGGQTGFKENFRDPNERAKAIEKELNSLNRSQLSPGRMAHAALDLLDGFNTTLENAVRLSAYSAALDKGMSRPQAARLGRELTVDFNRKGRAGRELGPLYAFFNASVQGSARTIVALKGPTGAKIIAGGLALGLVQALMLAAAGYDDDEIPEFVKTRSLIIPLFGDKKEFVTIPYPLGLHVIPNTSRVLTELVLNGGKDIGKRSVAAIGEIAGAFNPLGGGNIFTADGALKTIAPTLLDPVIEIQANKNFAGGSIQKEGYGTENDGRPGVARTKEATMRDTSGQAYIGISKAFNALTGGSDFEAGLVSPTPEMVRYLAQTVGGGVLREIEKTVNASVKASQGEEVKTSKIPVVGRFYGEVNDDDVQKTRYFNAKKDLDKLESQFNLAKKSGNAEAVERMLKEHPEIVMIAAQNRVQASIAKLNKLAVTVINDRETMKAVDDARVMNMRALNEAIEQQEKLAGKVTPGQKLREAFKGKQQEPVIDAQVN